MLICVLAGRVFGGIELVKKNFELVLVAIVLISVMPMAVEFILARRRRARGESDQPSVDAAVPLQAIAEAPAQKAFSSPVSNKAKAGEPAA